MKKLILILLFLFIPNIAFSITISSSDANTLDGFDSSYLLDRSKHTGIEPSSGLSGAYSGITGLGIIDNFLATGNACIGTTTSTYMLNIRSNKTNETAQIKMSDSSIIGPKAYIGAYSPTGSGFFTTGGTLFNNAWVADGTNAIAAIQMSAANADSSIVFRTSNTNAASPTNRLYIGKTGLIGVNTIAPQRQFSVVGDIQCTGNIYESNFAQGEMFVSYNTTAMNLVSASTYYTVTSNVQAGDLTNFTFTNSGTDAYLTCGKDGLYAVVGTLSFSGGNSDEFHGGLSINNANPSGCCEFNRKMGAGGDVGSAAFSGTVRLSATNTIRVKIENDTDADDPVIRFMNLSLYRIAP